MQTEQVDPPSRDAERGSPSDLLHEAAALMRERANGAVSRPPWTYVGDEDAGHYSLRDADGNPMFSAIDGDWDSDLPHIAAWHPAVAVAVAAWLETAGTDLAMAEGRINHTDEPGSVFAALAVARAYLGRES